MNWLHWIRFGTLSVGLSAVNCSSTVQGPKIPSGPGGAAPFVRNVEGWDGTFAQLPAGSIGPYVQRAEEDAVAVWAAPSAAGALTWFAQRLDLVGRAFATPLSLGPAPEDLGLVRLRRAGNGLLVLAVSGNDDEAALDVLQLDGHGKLLRPGRAVTRGSGALLWADALAMEDGGTLLVWARKKGTVASLWARRMAATGELEATTQTVYDGARAWQVAAVAGGALFAVATRAGAIELVPVDRNANPAPPARLEGTLHAQGDLDLLAVEPNRILLAFADQRPLEPHIYTAWLNARGGVLVSPQLAAPPRGPQQLYQLVGSASAQYLTWQDTREAPDRVNVVRVDPGGYVIRPDVSHELISLPRGGDRGQLEVAAAEGSFAALLNAGQGVRGGAQLIEFSDDLSASRSTPWRIDDASADAAWDLACTRDGCSSLAAKFADGARVALLSSAVSDEDVEAPEAQSGDEDAQSDDSDNDSDESAHPSEENVWRLSETTLDELVTTPELSALAASSDPEGTTLAWLSYFDPTIPYERPKTLAPDGRMAPVQAELRTQFIPNRLTPGIADGQLPASETISIRARSVAGVALARKGARQLLVWTAIDNGVPQVFTTELDATGRRLHQGMLTRQKGEVLAVRAAATNQGWIVAWIDSRRGTADAYVAAIGPSLERLTPDTRLDLGEEGVSGLDLVVSGGQVWVALAVGEGATSRLRVSQRDAQTLVERSSLTLPSQDLGVVSPRLALHGAGVAVAWIGYETRGSSIFLQELGSRAAALRLPVNGELEALALACDETCRATFTRRLRERSDVVALELVPDAEPEPLARLLSETGLGVDPASAAGRVYYFDIDSEGRHGIHRVIPESAR